ncbi:MAG: hypothetical protein ORN83_03330, partial [Chthoniobacteraceae bacterium]|nr:hypothetical protein [Chthoniobacteraceae bacterium]
PRRFVACVTFLIFATAGTSNALSTDELALLKRIDSPNIVQLREDASKLLQESPDSAVGHLVLSQVEEERANMASALREARAAWESVKNTPVAPLEGQPSLPALSLYRLAELYGNLDRRSEQLGWLEEYERLGCSKWEAVSRISYPASRLKVVALLKLGKVMEAERYLEEIEADMDKFGVSKDQAAMDRIRLAGAQSKNSESAWKLCQSLEAELKARSKRIEAGYLVNFGIYATRQLELDRAVAYYQEAAATINPDTRFNPFQKIAEIQMARGQWAEARISLGRAWAWLQTKRSAVRLEMRRALKLTVARYYQLYGFPDKALEHLDSAYAEPQRMRDSLDSAVRWKAEAAYQRAAALQARHDLFGGIEGSVATRPLKSLTTCASIWDAKQKFASLVAVAFAEPAAPLSALSVTTSPWPSWWLDMPAVYGKGSSGYLLKTLGMDGCMQSYAPALNAMVEGSRERSEIDAAKALESVPAWDLVTRARMERVLAESTNDGKKAIVHYANAYKLHPASLIGCGLPIRIIAAPGTEEIANTLAKSASVNAVKSEPSFILDLAASTATLKESDGVVLRQVSFDSSSDTRIVAARLLRGLFSAGASLTEQELAVLDGNVISTSKPSPQARP